MPDVPASAQDLIRQLLCRQEERLGRGGLDDFRKHPFFEGVDWERLATSTAPYIPELRGPMDTSNFDVDDDTLNRPVSDRCKRLDPLSYGNLPQMISRAVKRFQPLRLMRVMAYHGWFTCMVDCTK